MKLDLLLTKSNMDQQVRELMSNELRTKGKHLINFHIIAI